MYSPAEELKGGLLGPQPLIQQRRGRTGDATGRVDSAPRRGDRVLDHGPDLR